MCFPGGRLVIKSATGERRKKQAAAASSKNVAVRRNKRAAEQNDCITDCFNYRLPYAGK